MPALDHSYGVELLGVNIDTEHVADKSNEIVWNQHPNDGVAHWPFSHCTDTLYTE